MGTCVPSADSRRSSLAYPIDRPVVGYGGKTVNTLRLWAAATPDYFDFQAFQRRRVRQRSWPTAGGRIRLPGCSIPTIPPAWARALRFVQEYFRVACSLAVLVRRFRRGNPDWSALPDKVAIQLNDTHPSLAVPELMRILLDEARLGWERGLGSDAAHARLHQSHAVSVIGPRLPDRNCPGACSGPSAFGVTLPSGYAH